MTVVAVNKIMPESTLKVDLGNSSQFHQTLQGFNANEQASYFVGNIFGVFS